MTASPDKIRSVKVIDKTPEGPLTNKSEPRTVDQPDAGVVSTRAPGPTIDAGGALLLTVEGVAQALATSVKTIRRQDLAGKLPAPVRIGRGLRWRKGELHDWIIAGCPPRDEWVWRSPCLN